MCNLLSWCKISVFFAQMPLVQNCAKQDMLFIAVQLFLEKITPYILVIGL